MSVSTHPEAGSLFSLLVRASDQPAVADLKHPAGQVLQSPLGSRRGIASVMDSQRKETITANWS
jgi:hypothetical protein